jgi:D-amino peptidase
MRVYISCDIEGISGLNKVDYMYPEDLSIEKRRLVTQDVNAAIAGALEAGARIVFVNDTHPPERTILIDELDPAAQLIPNGMSFFTLQDIDDSFDALFLIGLHAKPGTWRGFLDHVWNPKAIVDIRVNGISMGEIGLNAVAAGHFGVPTALVTGDRAACEEAKNLLGEVETVVTKEGVSRYQARVRSPRLVREEIRGRAREALKSLGKYPPFNLNLPLKCEFDFVHTGFTQRALLIPGCEMIGPRCVAYTARDGKELLQLQLVLLATIAPANDPMY